MKRKKTKRKKWKIILISIIFLTIVLLIFNLNNIIYYIKLNQLNYSKNSIKNIYNNNIEVKKYSLTLDKIINTNDFILDNTSHYQNITYISKTNFFKEINTLIEKGYNSNDINTIYQKLTDITIILTKDYNQNISTILNSKYFKLDNLERYLNYNKDNIVLNVNMNLDYEFYTHDIEITNIDNTTIVNKYYKLNSTYVPNLVKINKKYAINDRQEVTEETKNYFEKMCEEATKDNIYIYSGSAYRSYNYQNTLYNNRVKKEGIEYANMTAEKAGYSEHQTGLAIDLTNKNFNYLTETDEEYKWLIKNSYKYGFILRYPDNKEAITAYLHEPWHFRYVGVESAKYIKENNLTLEEYKGMNF